MTEGKKKGSKNDRGLILTSDSMEEGNGEAALSLYIKGLFLTQLSTFPVRRTIHQVH